MSGHEFFDPWCELSRIIRQANELCDQMLRRLGGGQGPVPAFVPQCDIGRTRDEYIVRLALPGVLEEDIDLTLEGSVLIVRGERVNPVELAGGRILTRELRDGYFERRFKLPFPLKPEQVSVEYSDGMLLVRIRAPEEGGA